MAALTVRNIPDAVHRALRLRAARHGRSVEAEVRTILEETVQPPERPRLGTLLREMGRRAGVTDDDVTALEASMAARRDAAPHEPLRIE